MRILLALFAWFVIELVAFVEVVHLIGVLSAVLAVLVISAFGPWLVRQAGVGVWRRSQERLAVGEMPGREAVDGITLLVAGVLICVPGFVGDALGLLMLLPPGRAVVRALVGRWFLRRLPDRFASGGPGHGATAGSVVDASAHDVGWGRAGGPRPGLPGPA